MNEKQGGNENNEKGNYEVNPYVKSETNENTEENMNEKKGNESKQTETCATDTEILSYLNNPPLLFIPLGKYSSKQLVTNQSSHTKRAGAEKTSLPIINKYSWPTTFMVRGLQPFGRY